MHTSTPPMDHPDDAELVAATKVTNMSRDELCHYNRVEPARYEEWTNDSSEHKPPCKVDDTQRLDEDHPENGDDDDDDYIYHPIDSISKVSIR